MKKIRKHAFWFSVIGMHTDFVGFLIWEIAKTSRLIRGGIYCQVFLSASNIFRKIFPAKNLEMLGKSCYLINKGEGKSCLQKGRLFVSGGWGLLIARESDKYVALYQKTGTGRTAIREAHCSRSGGQHRL